MSDTDKKQSKNDPTKDPKFKKVIDHFLTTPPKPHGGKNSLTESGQKKPGDTPVKKRSPEGQ